ncbi:hydroxyacylglutathione hydrolase [Aquabacterium sp. A7-Y]|uniref:hydroxyacylglutathione hydrolase n=1 Tax=Aquabacterium sp. A7-Y TaxID=1349605 RepID=UPI00223D3973|nr:hydroxyacylglutathione hydrolase [Aquabacterium sp. A7-Y]MCW7540382.1 hydroxyacylglutathione hydrolase [Aquabacterium sp. A7-Y]
MELVALPAFADNYIWMISEGREALVVDPGQATPVVDALQARGLRLTGILVTHHHADHVGGLRELASRLEGPVYGPAGESIPLPCRPLRQGDQASWRDHRFQVFDVPGHTAGHIAYWSADFEGGPLLFCGDTLFSAGCGRLFEGTPAQMSASLAQLAALPGDTRVCCAHEYTLSNLRFAAAVEPGNPDIAAYTAQCEVLRAEGRPTLPSLLAQELKINPFLRCGQPAVKDQARARGAVGDDPVSVLAALRQWKNEFR